MSSPLRVARTGRKLQRYSDGFRLVAGCIPYRLKNGIVGQVERITQFDVSNVEIMMINSHHRHGLLFPKGGWETDETVEEAAMREAMEEAGVLGLLEGLVGSFEFKSKRIRNEQCTEGNCRAIVFAMAVTELLDEWPEKETRSRRWVNLQDAIAHCRHDWMKTALQSWIDSRSFSSDHK